MKFQDKVVIVTGSSSGIGAVTAVEYVKEGAKVTINGRNAESLAKTAEKCYEAGAKKDDVLSVVADITKEDERNKLVNDTIAKFGHIDILVNNAGWWEQKRMAECTLEDLDSMLDVHLRGHFALTQQVSPYIQECKGAIINISSGQSTMLQKDWPTYSIAKAAMDQMSKVFAVDLAEKGVRVNYVHPGPINTKGEELISEDTGVGVPEEVAKTILFLSSEDVTMITGAQFAIKGGWMLGGRENIKID